MLLLLSDLPHAATSTRKTRASAFCSFKVFFCGISLRTTTSGPDLRYDQDHGTQTIDDEGDIWKILGKIFGNFCAIQKAVSRLPSHARSGGSLLCIESRDGHIH